MRNYSFKSFFIFSIGLYLISLLVSGLLPIPKAITAPRHIIYLILVIFLISLAMKRFRESIVIDWSLINEKLKNDEIYKKLFHTISFIILFFFLKVLTINYMNFSVIDVDYSYFDLMISNFIRGKGWYSEACQCNHMGVHSTYIFYVLAPLHYMIDSGIFLQIIHAIVLWSALFPLKRTIESFGHDRIIVLVGLLHFSIYTYVIHNLRYNFHMESFYIPLFLWMLYFFDKEKWSVFHIFAFSTLLIKEDAGFYLMGVCAALALSKKSRKHALLTFFYASIMTVFSLKVFIPYFRETSDYIVAGTASKYGNNMKDVVLGMLNSPFSVLKDVFVGGWVKAVALFAFVPLTSFTFIVMTAPFILIHSTAASSIMSSLMLYYSAPFIPFVLFFFYKKIGRLKFQYRSYVFAIGLLCSALIGSGFVQISGVSRHFSGWLELNESLEFEDKKICAQSSIIAHLGYDSKIESLKNCRFDKAAYDYVIINPNIEMYPLSMNKFKKIKTTVSKLYLDKESFGDFIVYKN